MLYIFVLLIISNFILQINCQNYEYKILSGQPDDFNSFYPNYDPIASNVFLLPISTITTNTSAKYVPFPVDNCDKMFISLLLPKEGLPNSIINRVYVHLKKPSGFPHYTLSVSKETTTISDDFNYLCKTYAVSYPKIGTWRVRINLRKTYKYGRESYPVYVLVSFGGSSLLLETQIYKSQRMKIVQNIVYIGVNITMPTKSLTAVNSQVEPIVKSAVINSRFDIFSPDGRNHTEFLSFHNLNSNGEGKVSLELQGNFVPEMEGIYRVRMNISGQTEDGTQFGRFQWHLIGVSRNRLSYTNFNQITYSQGYFIIEIYLSWSSNFDKTYRIFSEIWGVIEETVVPICWVSHLTDIKQNSTGYYYLPLFIDPTWLLQYSKPPNILFLRNLTIEDIKIFSTLIEIDTLPVSMEKYSNINTQKLKFYLTKINNNNNNNNKNNNNNNNNNNNKNNMAKTSTNYESKPNLMMVHGYCAKENPFDVSNFTNFIVYKDWSSSLGNDEFARRILDFAVDNELKAFSIVSHSQGGLASLHLYAYYISGLDSYSVEEGDSNRKIQSLGSPYQGSPLAGLLADIGYFFGISCGSNAELTPDGAIAWLSKIPREVQKDVHYYRTYYGSSKKYCNFGTNVLLKGPNDGLVEIDKAILPFGVPQGITSGECHSVNMQWPPQCHNNQRNHEMNINAARYSG